MLINVKACCLHQILLQIHRIVLILKVVDTRHSMQKVDGIRNFGTLIDSQLNFKDYIQKKINKAHSIIGLFKKNFIHMDCNTFILLYKTLVHPHLDYANSVWSLYNNVIQ